ncbi:hypothetical protein WMY93_023166 [Mugilogobius chulae]|uniref:Ubiquinone biosynthesis protein n=1 Tax=Mugilogobius chulae TaxID=88201 RepID=A0AAW0NE11_9GOBI
MAAALVQAVRALRAGYGVGRTFRGLPRVLAPQCEHRRVFHRAALRLQDESKSDKPSSSTAGVDQHVHQELHEAPTEEVISEKSTDAGQSSSFQEQSGEHDEEYETEEQLQARILSAALEFVPVHGWSMEAIAAGAESLGLSSASMGMFSGAGELVLHFISHCNSQLTHTMAEEQNQIQLGQAERKKTADFLRDAVETRLRMHAPYIETWPQAMSLLLLPQNIPESLKLLSSLVDDIWYYAGDLSTDMNWYTKRAALTGIYNTTELVMVQDSSPDFQETWDFLDNRIKDVVNMANTAKQVQSTGEAVVQGFMGAALTLKNLTGINQRR